MESLEPYIRNRFLKRNNASLDINNYPLMQELNNEEITWNEKSETICYIGGITKIRGLEQVIDAMAHVKGVTLKLAGNFSPESFGEHLKGRNGWQSTDYLGLISRDNVQNVLRNSKAGIVTFLPFGNHTH